MATKQSFFNRHCKELS